MRARPRAAARCATPATRPPRGPSSTPRWPPASRSAAIVEIVVSPDRTGPAARPTCCVALGYTVPLAWRRRAPLAGDRGRDRRDPADGPDADVGRAALRPVRRGALSCAYACGAVARVATPGSRWSSVALPVITATMDDRVVADYVFPPPAGRRRLARGPRRPRAHAADGRAARGRGAARRGQRGGAAARRGRGAPPDRARDARPRRALDERDGRPGRRRAADPRARPGPGAGGRDADRAHRPRGAGRDAPPARRPQRPARGARPAADAGRDRRAGHARPRGGPADRPRIPRRAPRPPGGVGPRRLPDRPGRTHQCPQARRPRAHDRDRRLERAGADAGDPRPRRRASARDRRRRAWPGGHARTGAAVRRRARGGTGGRRRLARARGASGRRARTERLRA